MTAHTTSRPDSTATSQRPASSQPAAVRDAVQQAMDRRDNGGETGH